MANWFNPHSVRVLRKQFLCLFDNTGNGGTTFPKARQNFLRGAFAGMAISPELRAVKLDASGYTLFDDPQGELPPLRWPNGGHLALTFDAENREAFRKWFFDCLRSGMRLPIPNFISQTAVQVDYSPPADPPTPPLYEKKKAAKPTSEPQRKRKPKRIIESDDEDTTPSTASAVSTATASADPPKKKEKKEHKKRRDSKYDYEDEDGNLEDFVVSDGEIEFED
jgi:hypothetical protein